MPTFSKASLTKLATCHPHLQTVFNEVIKHINCTVICGYRNKEDQNKAFKEGKSKLKFPQSKHNREPSLAVDVVPYPIDWNDLKSFQYFGGFVMGVASQMEIPLIWGGHWKKPKDYPHFELKI